MPFTTPFGSDRKQSISKKCVTSNDHKYCKLKNVHLIFTYNVAEVLFFPAVTIDLSYFASEF